jgi:hypothetical protein
MPAKSNKQRRYLEAKFGHEWVKKHHMDKVAPKKKRKRKKK